MKQNQIIKDYFVNSTCLIGKPKNTLTFEIKQKNAQELIESTAGCGNIHRKPIKSSLGLKNLK
jgi:hypothetical protein